ncbi:class I SAM-dependent methyltransferase [Sphingobacterium bovistauri]|uniref:Class I SAM-dependent methyltransferase n=1 Tax=Sphingobacterium bovistauri TaxID=2781959 RepID=A0ABS7Z544_9SPHI|nr:class I SAM-dependent methyltransferase [Sphingobacterium bovistauri]MCA5005318.1 class I SAM-dependent methyltransferase [Sphingobacterium bovistauri]
MLNIYDPAYVKKLFNRMSTSYERMNYITSLGFSFIWRKQFIQSISPDKNEVHVLDLLSGLGENWKLLIKRFPNGIFSAIDFSEKMVESSQLKNTKRLDNRFEIIHHDILNKELPKEHFDVITCAFGLKTFNEEQIQQLAEKVFKSLKLGGKFTFIEISVPPNRTLQFLYKLYLSKVIPILGTLFLGNPTDYRMLWLYTVNFMDCNKAKLIFQKAGLHVDNKSYFYGCATGLIGYK